MLAAELIREENKIKELAMTLFGHEELPSFLFEEEKYKRVVLGLHINGAYAGIAYGVSEHGGTLFFLHHIYIKKEYRRQGTLLYLLEAVLRAGRESAAVKGAVWKYMMQADKTDPCEKLLNKISFCQIEENDKVMHFGIKTAEFEYLRKFKWYDPQLLEKKGCFVCRWFEYDACWKDSILETEKRKEREKDYLSPFIKDDSWKEDERSSFILAQKDTREPLGWILCQRLSEKEVKIRRFFVYTKARKLFLGPSFSTYVLDVIASLYEYLYFDVIPGNRQMEMFTSVYCKPILELNCVECNLKIKFKEEQQ